jgi:hypothetical protein
MALVLADRVRETTTVTGTGTATLLGAVSGYQSFAAVGNANTTYYVIANQSASEWEVGIGTYTASGTTLSRDTVLSSSNSGSLVNFSAGTKDVFVDYPAGRAVYEDAAGNVDGYPITGGTINNTVIGGTTPAAGTFTTLTATGQTSLGGVAGAEGLRVLNTASSTRYLTAQGSTADEVYLTASGPSGSNVALALSSRATGAVRFYTNTANQEQMRVSHTASAVNYVQVTGAATGARPTISAQGSDATAGLNIYAKGGSSIFFSGNANNIAFGISHVSSATNYIAVAPSVAGSAPVLSAQGTDTNISQVFQSKGTGAIDLAAGSSGVNISNGGTVTAVTRTVSGSGYTSLPTVAISAPTTAGGVQATASVGSMFTNTATVQSGGPGYTNGDVLTIVGGTAITSAATYTVTGVSGGAVTSVTPLNFNQYSVLPTNPVSTTGGTGSGATLNLTYGIGTVAFTITNAGSGYVEQPTVTFSGGGGSGAAAYATVGSQTVVKSLGTTTGTITNQSMMFQTPAGNSLLLRDSAQATPDAHFMVQATANGYALALAEGSNANASLYVGAKGTGSVRFSTSSTSITEQMRVAHTASAVNYVQVTGAATGNQPVISTQGSDANVILNIASKGNASIIFNANSAEQFRTGAVASAVNSLQLNGATTGNSPSLQARGSNTDIDVVFTPKGTGNVRFGTYTANMALTIQGYIEIKDSGGTVRRLAVIA